MAGGVERFGAVADLADLTAGKARALGEFLAGRDDVGCTLVEARQGNGVSWLIVEVAVDVGQSPVVDIRRTEPIALGFRAADRAWPKVWALREDFPQPLPHQFLVRAGEPAALCLNEAPWEDAKRRWSCGGFVRLLRTWLIDTARGALHREDQALEPFLPGSAARVIVPADLLDKICEPNRTLYGYALSGSEDSGQPIYRLRYEPLPAKAAAKIVAAGISTPPRSHAGIRHVPRTLADLRDALQADDFDFNGAVDAIVEAWLSEPPNLDALPLLLVHVPVSRHAGAEAERNDLWAFLLGDDVRQVAVALDLWSNDGDGGRVLSFQRKPPFPTDAVQVEMWSPIFELSPQSAAVLNGYAAPTGKRLAAVGAGALGSQVLSNLLRAGEELSAVADSDRLLPHNCARHAAWDQQLVGWPKAQIMHLMAERRFPNSSAPRPFVIDAADPGADGAAEPYREALGSADIILDFAASVPVSRQLCLDEPGDGRRISAFLSPAGQDLVVLAEDAARTVRLDHLEQHYYGAVVADERLEGHFAMPGRTRYARSCREVSAQLPQAHVALHAGLAAGVIRQRLEDERALAAVWRLNPATHEVRRIDLDTRPMRTLDVGAWTVLVSEDLLAAVVSARASGLPAETGGVLVGDFDTSRRRIYLTMALASPPDSIETPGSYIRGSYGLQESVRELETRTLSMLQYIGEWHSHPDRSPATPSEDDLMLYRHLSEEMAVEGYPPVMLIVSDGHFGLLIDNVLALAPTAEA